jgi:tetratricopeptide (TPR) repeat protein
MRLSLHLPGFATAFLATVCVSASLCGAPQAPLASTLEDAQPSAAPPAAELTPLQRGDLYMARKMFREAIDMYRRAMTGARDYFLQNKIGMAYQHMQNNGAAKKSYNQALKLNSQYWEARNNLGTLAYERKDYRGAIREYTRALVLNPNSATVYSNLGTAYFARKRYQEAAKAYQQAVNLDPDVFDKHGTAGSILQERSIEERAKFHYYMAKTYAEAGMLDRALLSIRKALEEGFKDKQKFLEEPAFAALQDLPEFKQVIAAEIRVL